ncbi:MAG TPA: hypothetical protein DCP90_08080 [Clostridiales bacterium]|nr:MAG: hypothetical protein A2Y22_00150 [Clostridiales bacterium GWD2_32_59]HAN10550.1 hypothetical protein [Clostridiales bacterium]
MNRKSEELYGFDEIEKKLKSLPERELPSGFHSSLMSKIYNSKEEGGMKFNELVRFLKPKTIGVAVAAVLLVAALIHTTVTPNYNTSQISDEMATGSQMYSDAGVDLKMSKSFNGGAGVMEQREADFAQAPSTGFTDGYNTKSIQPENQIIKAEENLKIIKTANVTLEILDFDGVIATIRNLTTDSGGYVESSSSYIYESHPDKNEYLKRGNIKLRVPKEKYEDIKTQVGNIGKVISTSEGTENVTEVYIEAESRIKTLEIEQERLLEIMKKATKVEELIQLEERLSELRTQLESYKSQVKNWDKLVAFSTIYIDLTQVRSQELIYPVDKNLTERIQESFVSSINNIKTDIEDLTVWIAGNFIGIVISIIVYGALIIIIIVGIKKAYRKFKK